MSLELLISAFVTRLVEILGPLLERFPTLMVMMEKIAAKLSRAGKLSTMEELDAELDRSFAATFTEHVEPGAPGAPASPVAPEIRAGFQASEIAPLKALLGRPLNSGSLSLLADIWTDVANPGEAASLTLQNKHRGLFDNSEVASGGACVRTPTRRGLLRGRRLSLSKWCRPRDDRAREDSGRRIDDAGDDRPHHRAADESGARARPDEPARRHAT